LRKQKLHGGIKSMAEEAIKLGGKKKSKFIDKVKELLPEGGNLNLSCAASMSAQ
jgi:hypothetical protein